MISHRLYADKIQVRAQGKELPILFESTFSINKEEFIVLLGHNGSGKSTLIKTLAGNIKPSAGNVLIDGITLTSIPAWKKAQEIIVLAQKADDRLFSELTLEENITLWESRYQAKEQLNFEDIIALTGMPKRFLSLKKQQVKHLSGGEKQSILLSLALAHPPKLLFLDEHTASLDYNASIEIMNATNEAIINNKITAVMVTHNLDHALNYGNRLIVMNEGRIAIDQKKSSSLGQSELKEMMNIL